jgi:stage V sporulation protein G
MLITEIKIFPRQEDKLKAYVTITLDNSFVVRNLKIIEGSNGLFVAMPSRKRRDGTFMEIAHPLTGELRRELEQKILAEYKRETVITEFSQSPESQERQRAFENN